MLRELTAFAATVALAIGVSTGAEDRTAVEWLTEALYTKDEQLQALSDLRQQILSIRMGPADYEAKQCLRELAGEVQQLSISFATLTHGITFSDFRDMLLDDPEEAQRVADGIYREFDLAQDRFAERFHAPQDCMYR